MKIPRLTVLAFLAASGLNAEPATFNSVLHGPLQQLEKLPSAADIANVSLTELPNAGREFTLDAALFKRIFGTAVPIAPNLADKNQSMPWYSGSFTAGGRRFSFELGLGGLGILTLPSGKKGAFSFDYLLCANPSKEQLSGCWRTNDVIHASGRCQYAAFSFMEDGSLRAALKSFGGKSCDAPFPLVMPWGSSGFHFVTGPAIGLPDGMAGRKLRGDWRYPGALLGAGKADGVFAVVDDRLCFSDNFSFRSDGMGLNPGKEDLTINKNNCLKRLR